MTDSCARERSGRAAEASWLRSGAPAGSGSSAPITSPSSSRNYGLSSVVGRSARSKWNRVLCRRSSPTKLSVGRVVLAASPSGAHASSVPARKCAGRRTGACVGGGVRRAHAVWVGAPVAAVPVRGRPASPCVGSWSIAASCRKPTRSAARSSAPSASPKPLSTARAERELPPTLRPRQTAATVLEEVRPDSHRGRLLVA